MLARLSEARGVSGHEGPVRKLLKEAVEKIGLTYTTDTMGNLYVHKPNKGRKIMVCAHMDEVGMLVSGATEAGLLSYQAIGLDPRAVVSKRVLIGRDNLPGVIGAKAIHHQTKEEFERSLKHKELFIDIGANSREEALKAVSLGDPVCFDTKFGYFGENMMKGKALDDRVGCAIILELLKEDYDCDFYAVFTVQEEVGLRGIRAAAYNTAPELALILEGTTANDMPEMKGHQHVTRLNAGPAISFMDRTTITNPVMLNALIETAEREGIPYQLRQGTTGGTDAGILHKALGGCVTGGISLPCRYIHSPISVASVTDYKNMTKLASRFLSTAKYEEVLRNV